MAPKEQTPGTRKSTRKRPREGADGNGNGNDQEVVSPPPPRKIHCRGRWTPRLDGSAMKWVWNNQSMRHLIFLYAASVPRTCARMMLVCRSWRSHIDDHSSLFWWPLFRGLWLYFNQTYHRRHTTDMLSFEFTNMVIAHIDKHPNHSPFTLPSPGGSWKEQYRLLMKTLVPRLVWYDCSDGRPFLPSGGWYEYVHKDGRVFDYWASDTRGAVEWIKQLSVSHASIECADDSDVEFDGDEEEDRGDLRAYVVQKLDFWTAEHIEFHKRIAAKHTFCLHWSAIESRHYDRHFGKKLSFAGILSTVREEDSPSCHIPHRAPHGHPINGCRQPCEDRCAVLLPVKGRYTYSPAAAEQRHYQIITSTDCTWAENLHSEDRYSSNLFSWVFEFEEALRTNAGYYADYTPVKGAGRWSNRGEGYASYMFHDHWAWTSDFGIHGPCWQVRDDADHYQVICPGICGFPYDMARREICRTLHLSKCALACDDKTKDVWYNETLNNRRGCKRLLGPAIARRGPELPCGHAIPRTRGTDYCFDCVQTMEGNAKKPGRNCKQCRAAKRMSRRALLSVEELCSDAGLSAASPAPSR